MLRYLFLFLLLIHALIHLMGFAKAYQWAELEQLTLPISKSVGLWWLAAAVLFLASAVLFWLAKNSWPIVACIAVVVSQLLIIYAWQDAKVGTIANVIILTVALFAWAGFQLENSYRQDVQRALAQQANEQLEILTEADMAHLPTIVQQYIRYTQSVGKPKVIQLRMSFKGQMREKGKEWFDFTSEQHSFFTAPARLFFMKAKVKGLPAVGYHSYQAQEAQMKIKLLSAIPVVDLQGEDLFRTETVTFFNDLCLLAPAALIDERIQWDSLDEHSVRATFTNQGVTISADLFFNEMGQLTNFVSDDRTDVNLGRQVRFSTPISQYKVFNSYRLGSYGEAIWAYPDGDFTYGKFWIKEVVYN